MAEFAGSKPSKVTKPIKPFRFFDLPRELRDRVYRVALVTPLIDIDQLTCASDDDDESIRKKHARPEDRTTYVSLGKLMTYQLAKPRPCGCGGCPKDPEPQLQLFYVSRTVYEEAREIFYKENEFSTILGSGMGLDAFLKDRAYAIPMIRRLNLDVPVHTADHGYARWTDKHYKALFKLIKEKTDIRHLTLNFHGLVPSIADNQWVCPCQAAGVDGDLMALSAMMMGAPGPPSDFHMQKLHTKEWAMIKTLTSTITDLHRLSINVDFCFHMLDYEARNEEVFDHEHIRGFIGYLRSKMLKKGAALGTTQIHGYCRTNGTIEDKRYRFHSDDDATGTSYLRLMKNGAHDNVRHDHMDSGSELDDDVDLPDLEDISDEWEDENDEDEEYLSDEDDDSDMPALEDSSDDEMPELDDDDLD